MSGSERHSLSNSTTEKLPLPCVCGRESPDISCAKKSHQCIIISQQYWAKADALVCVYSKAVQKSTLQIHIKMHMKISYFLRSAYWISIYFTNNFKPDNAFESKIISAKLYLAMQRLVTG